MKRVRIGVGLMVLGVLVALLPMHVEMTGLTLGGYGFLCLFHAFAGRRGWPRGWQTAAVAVGVAVAAALTAGIIAVLALGRSDWDAARRADYAVVLGAQIRGDQPSRTLRERLELARTLMEENPDVVVIVSGGQGPDEEMTEAGVMYDYLKSRGADTSRLYREDRAHNTRENLQNSAEIAASLGIDPAKPVIVTSEFHLCRAKYIAGTLGLAASGVACRTTPWYLAVNYALRELFAFVKAWFVIRFLN